MKIKLIMCSLAGKRTMLTIMRTFIFLFSLTIFGLNPENSFSQDQIIIDKDMIVTVDDIFNIIEKQTDYHFMYPQDLFLGTPKVQLKKGGIKISQLLNLGFSGNNIEYELSNDKTVKIKKVAGNTALSSVVQTQGIQLKGTLKDERGIPLAGATIIEKGTSNGTQTDFDGNFSLTVSGTNAILQVSYIGFISKEIPVLKQTNFNIVLQDNVSNLEEIVLVGYGQQRKGNVSDAIGVVNERLLKNQASANAGEALQGALAGVLVSQSSGNPRSDVNITIRGLGTFGANPNPLIVVDGIITSQGLRDLDPNNIANITVLKDASSAAIYGSRGANGVVLVTSKRGREGKSQINLSFYTGMDEVSKKLDVVNATEFAILNNQFYENAGAAPVFADPQSYGQGTNWQDEIFRTGYKNKIGLSFSGGNEKSQYSLSIGYQKIKGIILNTENDRFNLSNSLDFTPIKGLKISNTFISSYSVEKEGDPQAAVQTGLRYSPTVPATNADGSLGIASQPGESTDIPNPVLRATILDNTYALIRTLEKLSVEYEIIPGLTAKVEGALEYVQNNNTEFTPSYDFGFVNVVDVALLNREINYNLDLQFNGLLTYDKKIGNHAFDALAGYTIQSSRFEYLRGQRQDFAREDDNNQVLNGGTTNDLARGGITKWAIQSYLGRLNYTYNNKYLLKAVLRVDESSRFAKGNRVGYFPSFSAGWIVSKEAFMEKYDKLSYFKLRGGYGVLGNQDIGVYPYQAIIGAGSNYVFGTDQNSYIGRAPSSLVNSDISWESTSTLGIGADINFLDDKLKVILDYYQRHTSDILLQVPIPAITGNSLTPAFQNAGEAKNKGYEVTVSYGNFDEPKDFKYNLSLNFSDNDNEVTALNNEASLIYTNTRTTEGQAINSFYGYKMVGIFQNQAEIAAAPTQPNAAPGDIRFADLNDDKVINDADRTFIGSNLVEKIVGFNGQFEYKNLDLSFSFVGEFGKDGYTQGPGFDINRSGEFNSARFIDSWNGEGTSNNFPRLVSGDPNNNKRVSTFYLASRDYIRLKNLQIGYNVPLKDKSKLRIYVAGQNLFTSTDWPGFDPQLGSVTDTFPLTRTIYMGLNFSL